MEYLGNHDTKMGEEIWEAQNVTWWLHTQLKQRHLAAG